jgi:SARP family transcriptional regulator, regulator of embCAB operon
VDFQVLGPLRACQRGATAVPSARKPRQVLSLLLLNNRRVVPFSALVAELWEEDNLPKRAQSTLQIYILQLRKALAAALGCTREKVAHELLITNNHSYSLQLEGHVLDVETYYTYNTAGDAALRSGDYAAAVTGYRNALAQWRGPALVDVFHGSLLQAEVARLEQQRLTTVERKIESELQLGRPSDALPELASLTIRHRFHEPLHGNFMLALYRSGNRTGALDAYHRLRSSMVSELGLEPSRKLQRLQYSILTSAPELDAQRSASQY